MNGFVIFSITTNVIVKIKPVTITGINPIRNIFIQFASVNPSIISVCIDSPANAIDIPIIIQAINTKKTVKVIIEISCIKDLKFSMVLFFEVKTLIEMSSFITCSGYYVIRKKDLLVHRVYLQIS